MLSLFDHQKQFVQIGTERDHFAWFAEPGCGKTIGMLAVCDLKPMKTLVLAPKSILHSAWLRDAKNFPSLNADVIYSTNKIKRLQMLNGNWFTGITNYDTFKSHAKDFLVCGVRRLIVDESSKLKSHDSQITQAVWEFADRCDSVYMLCGTPAPNNVTEYFGQLRAMGRTVAGESFFRFANRYATPVKRKVFRGGKAQDVVATWTQTEKQKQDLQCLLKQWSWSLKKEDCLSLPRQHDIIYPVLLDEEEIAYTGVQSELKLETTTGTFDRFKAEAQLIKLRQITGGVVRVNGEPRYVGRSKLDALGQLLDEIGAEPVVIWAEFTGEIDRIVAECVSRNESVATIDGRTSMAAGDIAARFQRGEIQRLICHPAAAGHGITLTAARYCIYYSLSFSYEQYEQSRNRIHRIGQDRACTYYHLLSQLPATGHGNEAHAPKPTVDFACWRVVRKKGTVAEEMKRALGMAPEIDVDEEVSAMGMVVGG